MYVGTAFLYDVMNFLTPSCPLPNVSTILALLFCTFLSTKSVTTSLFLNGNTGTIKSPISLLSKNEPRIDFSIASTVPFSKLDNAFASSTLRFLLMISCRVFEVLVSGLDKNLSDVKPRLALSNSMKCKNIAIALSFNSGASGFLTKSLIDLISNSLFLSNTPGAERALVAAL